MYAGQGYVALTTYLHPTVRRSMAEQIQQQVALHCFTNLVEFLNIHKFETDLASSLWRKLFLNICLSSIDHMNVKKSDLSAVFNLDRRTISENMTALTVHEIKFPQPNEARAFLDKRESGAQLIYMCKGNWADHHTTSPKKNDIMVKHVRGEGLQKSVEINGLKEFQSDPGRYW